jgi:hypothetical protein
MSKIIAAFCGTGKTTLCKDSPSMTEIECWEYRKGNFPNNYIEEILTKTNDVCISTDPTALIPIIKSGAEVVLIYPNLNLFDEYMKRYSDRNSSYDFIGVMYKHWHEWIEQLHDIKGCEHIKLTKGQYLTDVL